MSAPAAPSGLPSFRTTLDAEPYGFYEEVRARGIAWDDEIGAWLVNSYALIRWVMRQDKKLVRHTAADMQDERFHAILGGKRSRLLAHGEDQTRHHRWFVHRFSYGLVDQWRTTLLRPILDRLLDDVVEAGRIEFVSELSDRFSVRVMTAVMGFPYEDDDWIRQCKALIDHKQRYIDTFRIGPTEEVTRNALQAIEEMNELVTPLIEEARAREPRADDILALLWADGPSIMPGWDLEDMLAWVTAAFFAGTDTTTHAINNALYLVMTAPGMQDTLRAGTAETIERFSEEVLRLYPSVQYIPRFANQDFELGGVQIKKDDYLFMLDAGANRDPARFGCPAQIDLERDSWREHLAFSVGPRTCAGAALARAEVQEAVAKSLERLPNLRLDPDAEPPQFKGFTLRSFRPLHALFDTAA